MFAFLHGHKSQIVSGLLVLVSFAYFMKWIDLETSIALGIFLGGGGVAAVRHGVATEAAKVLAKVERVETKVEAVVPDVARVTEQIVQAAAPPASSGRPR